jgi:nucleoside phosphorylase/5'-deoxynucleotidase YfbR-like HD superfamily hydrolase
MSGADQRPHFDCLLVIALHEEFARLSSFFAFQPSEYIADDLSYQPFSFHDRGSIKRRGVAIVVGVADPIAAALVAERALQAFTINMVVNIGIAGAMSSDLRLGDVVVANEADSYAFRGKIISDPPEIAWGGQSFPPTYQLHTLLESLPRHHPESFARWRREGAERIRSLLSGEAAASLLKDGLLRDAPDVTLGPLASGPFVVTSSAFQQALRSRNRNFQAVEVEAAAVLKVVYQSKEQPLSLVIKGISDFADQRKEQFDATAHGAIRTLAMQNALALLDIALRTCVDFGSQSQSEDAAEAAFSIPGFAAQLHALAMDRYITQPHQRRISTSLASLESLYGSLFECLASPVAGLAGNGSIIDRLVLAICKSGSRNPLRIDGLAGTGKSTLLVLLYLHMHSRFERGEPVPVPVYVNLHAYDSRHDSGHASRADQNKDIRERITKDLKPLIDLLRDFPDCPVALFVDGVEEFVVHERVAETLVLEIAERNPANRKIVVIGLSDNRSDEFFYRSLAPLGDPEIILSLRSIPSDSTDIAAVAELFAQVVAFEARPDLSAVILAALRRFAMPYVDLFSLALVATNKKEARNRSSLLRSYCEAFLLSHSPRGPYTLVRAAELAYRYFMAREDLQADEIFGNPCWSLLHRHALVRDFLLGLFVIEKLKAVGRDQDDSFEHLAHVYPHGIDRNCKEIMNLNVGNQRDVLDGIKRTYAEGPASCRPHICYLAGRLADPALKVDAAVFLRKCKDEFLGPRTESLDAITEQDLLLIRTIFISLVELGDWRASDEYIDHLIRNPVWNNLNRGFHLEYYGDIAYDSTLDMTHKDLGGPSYLTRAFLARKINERSDGGKKAYPLLDIEVFTLYSLAQDRHARGDLQPDELTALLEFTQSIVEKSEIISKAVSRFCRMVASHLGNAQFKIGDLAAELFQIKKVARRGWELRGLVGAERVSEHIYGAYLLGLLFLPDKSDEETYDKKIILDTILIHDLSEAFTGDKVNKNDQDRKSDERWYSYLGLLGTYEGVADMSRVETLWRQFEAGETLNARVAKDLDKLDNLLQLFLYEEAGNDIQDFAIFESDLVRAVNTDFGENILEIIRSAFPKPGRGAARERS